MDSVSQSLAVPPADRSARNKRHANGLEVHVEDDSTAGEILPDTIEQFPDSQSPSQLAATSPSKGKGRARRSPTPPSPSRSSHRLSARRKASVLQRGMTAPLVLEP